MSFSFTDVISQTIQSSITQKLRARSLIGFVIVLLDVNYH
jgi:hypothetical protein